MKHERFLYLILSIILLTPCILTSLFPDESSSSELRIIQELPSLPTNIIELKLWPRHFENYVADHLFLRGFTIKKISKVLYDHGISINKEVLLGQEEWMFLSHDNDVIDKYRGVKKLSDEEAIDWIKDMSSRVYFLKKKGIDCWFIIVPDKSTVYHLYLPMWCSKVGPSFTDILVQNLKEQKSIKWIDLRPLLIEEARNNKIYYKYDTHWNDYGSYLAYQYIIQRIHKDIRVSPIEKNEVRFINKNISGGDLAGLLGLKDFLTEDTKTAEILNTTVVYKKGEQDLVSFMKDGFATVTSGSSSRAVILCDSFVHPHMVKYLQVTFSFTFFKHHDGMEFDKDLILQQHPDVVLYIVVERLIPSKLTSPNH